MDKWISVKDQLPPDLQRVLVWRMRSGCAVSSLFCGNWLGDDGLYSRNRVTHWRPLPDGPEEAA